MEIKFDLPPAIAEMALELREERGSVGLDAMVSKMIPYALYRKASVDVVYIFFEDVRRDFLIDEEEKEEGKVFSDREVRELVAETIAACFPPGAEAEIDIACQLTLTPAACVKISDISREICCEEITSAICRFMEPLPLVELYPCYAAENGEICDEIPEGEDPSRFEELTGADIFYCEGAEPGQIEEIEKLLSLPENHSYDYLAPQYDGEEEE